MHMLIVMMLARQAARQRPEQYLGLGRVDPWLRHSCGRDPSPAAGFIDISRR